MPRSERTSRTADERYAQLVTRPEPVRARFFRSLELPCLGPPMASRRLAFPLLGLAFLSLLLGIWAGLVRVGWPWPSLAAGFWLAHGPLMVSGFVGTLIAVERAVTIGRRWGYIAPALTAAGALVLVATTLWIAPLLIVMGSAVLAALFAVIFHRQPNPATAAMLLGAVAWVVG